MNLYVFKVLCRRRVIKEMFKKKVSQVLNEHCTVWRKAKNLIQKKLATHHTVKTMMAP